MSKTLTYLYPEDSEVANLKIFQEKSSKILAYYFTRENMKYVKEDEYATNHAIYFLFDESEDDIKKVYVGQSIKGILRIENQAKNKAFWSKGIMIVTDNNSFDKTAIDYLEHEFIQRFKKSSYTLINTDLRDREPNIGKFEKPTIEGYINQVTFLLNAEGINTTVDSKTGSEEKYFYPPKQFKAKICVRHGQFVLVKNSEVKRPTGESAKGNNEVIDRYIEEGKVAIEDDRIITVTDLAFQKPSQPGTLVAGYNVNGWDFFKELNSLRK